MSDNGYRVLLRSSGEPEPADIDVHFPLRAEELRKVEPRWARYVAAMVASMKEMGVLPGVDRPCLASVMPNMTGRPTVLLDVGANVGCRPENIAQFAVMGSVYAEEVLGLDRPRVGVLSVGEEDGKGSATTKEAAQALRRLVAGS